MKKLKVKRIFCANFNFMTRKCKLGKAYCNGENCSSFKKGVSVVLDDKSRSAL